MRYNSEQKPKSQTKSLLNTILLLLTLSNASSRLLLPSKTSSPNKEEPSHIRMCRGILKPSPRSAFVREDPSVCTDDTRPHQSLLKIFASTLLSKISRTHNLGVSYSHKCDAADNKAKTVQRRLPSPYALDLESMSEEMELDTARTLCRKCILDFEQGRDDKPDCILFTDSSGNYVAGAADSASRRRLLQRREALGIDMILPAIKRSIRKVANSWPGGGDLQEFVLKESYAVIYLSCHEESRCDDDDGMHSFRHIVGKEIPSYMKRIDIVASGVYMDRFGNEVRQLMSWVKKFYPRAQSVTLIDNAGTDDVFSRMMKANYLLCGPGKTCILPALSTGKHASIVKGERFEGWVDLFTLQSSHVRVVEFDFKGSQCRFLRGRSGKWVKDEKLAPKLQYRKIKGNKLFHPSTMYRWEDNFKNCHIDLLTLDNLCSVIHDLEVKRLFFFGDSLTRQMTESLWRMIYNTSDEVPFTLPDLDEKDAPHGYTRIRMNDWQHTIKCPKLDFSFEMSYLRNDYITEVNIGLDGDHLALPWIDKYLNDPGKTIMVVNTGPHVHDMATFQRVFDGFVSAMDRFDRPDDIIMFRTTVPGHKKCQEFHEPFKAYREFASNMKAHDNAYKDYSWEHHVEFNDYAARVIADRNRNGRHKYIEFLDVYSSGVLRPDGHLNPKVKRFHGDKPQDCLHSRLPGPIDWWNHIFLSNLQSMAMEKNEK